MGTNVRSEEYELRSFKSAQGDEYDAWLALVKELRQLGVGQIETGEPHERLYDLITLWGEELVQLRLADPDPTHAGAACIQRREKVHGS